MLGRRLIAAVAVGVAAAAPLTATAAPGPSVLVTIAPADAPEVLGPFATPALPRGSVARLERRAGRPLPELRGVYRLRADGAAAARRLAGRLDARPGVEASLEAAPAPPPAICRAEPAGGWPPFLDDEPTPDLAGLQDYRAGLGIPGGAAGLGVRIADLEYEWRPSHEELGDRPLDPPVVTPGGLDPGFQAQEHGTAVLGILGADDDGAGITGLAHQAEIRPLSPFLAGAPGTYDLLNSTLQAALGLRPGDVLLIEQQSLVSVPTGMAFAPVEVREPVRDLIRAVVDAGIVVVEPAGNGGRDLASFGQQWLSEPSHPDRSGAIIVGGAGSAATGSDLVRIPGSNFGARVDLQGYGAGVLTTGYGQGLGLSAPDRLYTSCFDGTSSASATVAGAVAALQGIAIATTGAPLTPAAVRQVLVATGTPQAAPALEPIGPRPLVFAAAALIQPAEPSLAPAPVAAAPPPVRAAPPPAPVVNVVRPAVRGAGARLDRRAGTLTISLRGIAPRAVVLVGRRRVRLAAGRVVLDGARPRRILVVVSAAPGPRASYARSRFLVIVPARGPARVRRL